MLIYLDSFDHYTTQAQMGLKGWTGIVGNNVPVAAQGRNGTYGCSIHSAGGGGGYMRRSLTAQASYIAGCSFKPVGGGDVTLFTWEDSAQGPGEQMSLKWVNATTRLQVFRNGTLLATSAATIPAGSTHYIEFKVTIHNTTGAYEVRIDGAVDANLTATGVNTRGVGTLNSTDMLRVGGTPPANFLAAYIDDLYISDLTGALNNNYLGDIRVQALFATAAGATTQWAPTPATNNYSRVNETTPDDDTSYVSDATVGDIDTYTFGDLAPSAGTVKGLQTVLYARKDDAGVRTIAPMVREGATNYVGPSHNLGTTYQFYPDIYETDPATAAAWTVANVNADEFGVKVIA